VRLLRGCGTLFWLTFDRLLWSSATLAVLFPLLVCVLVLRRWRFDGPGDAFDRFSGEFVFTLFAGFIVPICTLAYATTSIGGEREDGTLVFLLLRPLPRPLLVCVKFLATLPLIVGAIVIGYWLACWQAGAVGTLAFRLYLAPLVGMSLAYAGLFHLFAVCFRHATILAVVYALFVEFVLGNMPGIVKRVAVNFYGRSIMAAIGVEHGVNPPPERWFVPVSAEDGAWMLAAIAIGGLALAAIVFQRREYREAGER
jgi:ABC-type transport system involved in multi-copper enzyme maturation permease subunit